jgi:ribonuclease HI
VVTAAGLFQDLGFMVNFQKSVFRPTQKIEFLGFLIDSVGGRVSLPTGKADRIVDMVCRAKGAPVMTVREVARLLGVLVATGPGNRFAALFTRNMERDKIQALRQFRKYEARMSLANDTVLDLDWWLHSVHHAYREIWMVEPQVVINTDASLEGWGAYRADTGQKCGSRWTVAEARQHINCLELLAVKLALQSLCRNIRNQHIRVMTDNTTTRSCINKQGSTWSDSWNMLTREIWFWALETDNWFLAMHVPGVENIEADEESRKFNEAAEWGLAQKVFKEICQKLGQPTVDLFASRLNFKYRTGWLRLPTRLKLF